VKTGFDLMKTNFEMLEKGFKNLRIDFPQNCNSHVFG